jgi:hypothetical protein
MKRRFSKADRQPRIASNAWRIVSIADFSARDHSGGLSTGRARRTSSTTGRDANEAKSVLTVPSRVAHISRADLLRLIDRAKSEEREAIAALMGFERCESQRVPVTSEEALAFEEQCFEPSVETKVEKPFPTTITASFLAGGRSAQSAEFRGR